MNQAGTNEPEGKGYNMASPNICSATSSTTWTRATAHGCSQMMDALPQIEEWRHTLALTERLKLNHPNAVLRKFKAAFEVPDPSKPVKPGLRDSVAELSEENMQLKAHIVEFEAARTREPLQLPLEKVRAAYIRSLLSGLEGEADLQVELGILRTSQ